METSNPMAKGNAAFLESQQKQTSRMIEQQDASLEALGKSVDGLGRMASEIREEVQEQGVLLNKLGEEVDDAGAKMDVVTASLSKLLQTKDGCQIWTIVILTLILILLSKNPRSRLFCTYFSVLTTPTCSLQLRW